MTGNDPEQGRARSEAPSWANALWTGERYSPSRTMETSPVETHSWKRGDSSDRRNDSEGPQLVLPGVLSLETARG